MTRRFLFGVVVLAALWGQGAQPPSPAPAAKAVLANSGAPMRVPYQCSNEDMEWAGMTCSEEEPCPVYLELAAIESVGNRIFLAGNLHSSSSTLYSILLMSEDAGKTWAEPYDRMRGIVLDHMQFLDFETGWAAGETLVPVAQDPFFLITSDGGKTWRKRAVFNENRAGTIADFWFSSRTAGSLLIDRSQSGEEGKYELYESMTGGESWMLREVNEKPLRMRTGRASESDWRIHPDAPSQSFRIEKRLGEKWTSPASFLVKVGSCKPVEAPAAEPPSENQPPPAESTPVPATPSRRQPPSLKKPPQ